MLAQANTMIRRRRGAAFGLLKQGGEARSRKETP
jgi:hypothetical protein